MYDKYLYTRIHEIYQDILDTDINHPRSLLDARFRPWMHSFVCCSVLQCVAVCCSVLQCVAVCCSVLQCVAVCCIVFTHSSDLYYQHPTQSLSDFHPFELAGFDIRWFSVDGFDTQWIPRSDSCSVDIIYMNKATWGAHGVPCPHLLRADTRTA